MGYTHTMGAGKAAWGGVISNKCLGEGSCPPGWGGGQLVGLLGNGNLGHKNLSQGGSSVNEGLPAGMSLPHRVGLELGYNGLGN